MYKNRIYACFLGIVVAATAFPTAILSSAKRKHHSESKSSPSFHKEVLIEGKRNYTCSAGIRFNKFYVDDPLIYTINNIPAEILILNSKTGKILERIQTKLAIPDDLDIGPDTACDQAGIKRGTIYYTSPYTVGGIGRIRPDGTQDVIVSSVPFTNGISFSPKGDRLYISQVFNPGMNGVFEVLNFDNPNATVPTTRTIVTNIDSFGGGLEGFCTGKSDGFIYGPLVYSGTCVKIDPDTGTVTNIPSDKGPQYAATHADLDSKGRLLVSDIMGRLIRINNLQTGQTDVLQIA